MEFVIGISLIALYFIGFIFIDKIYKIANPCEEKDVASQKNENKSIKETLLYGDRDCCEEISKSLDKYGISSEIFYDLNDINMSKSYRFLIAASKSDLDNLTVCSIGTKMMEINKVFAVCNQPYNKKIYEENNISIFNRISASDIALTLLNIN